MSKLCIGPDFQPHSIPPFWYKLLSQAIKIFSDPYFVIPHGIYHHMQIQVNQSNYTLIQITDKEKRNTIYNIFTLCNLH